MTLSIGFLGYQFMGRAHANALARLPMFFPEAPAVERTVLVGRDESALETAVEQLGFDHYRTDWRPAIEEVDVFYNLGPNNLHHEPSVAALETDVPVLCEKPLAHTLDAAGEMAAAARESSATSAIAFNYRFVPAIQRARELIAAGALGDIYHVRARYLQDWLADPRAPWSWRNDEDTAGSGALGDLGAHSIDLAQFLLDEQVERVSGHLRTFVENRPVPDESPGETNETSEAETRPVTVDDAFSAQASFAGGAMGTFEATRCATGHDNANVIEVNGSDGSLRFHLERLNELEVHRADDRGFETVLVTDDTDPYGDRWWPPGHVLGWEHTFVHENYEFLSAVAAGEPYTPDFQDGLAVQRVMAAIEESDDRGEWVAV